MQNYDRVSVGTEAVDRNGDSIGTVDEVGADYVVVRKGLIFPKDIFIPFAAIDSVDSNGIRVNVDKDTIDSMGWDHAPADAGVTSRGDAAYVENETSYTSDRVGSAEYETRGSVESTDDTIRVPIHEEELRAEKTRAQAGEVEIRKDVVAEEQTLDVPVTREEIEVRRYAVDRAASDAEVVDTGDTIRVPVMGERVNVEKDVRVTEEVEVSKRAVTDTERVSDTVRREEVNVERDGDVDVVGDTGRPTRSTR